VARAGPNAVSTTNTLPRTLRPASTCLFLDVDGTLIDLGPTPDSVTIDASLLQLLHAASAACDGAVALVSGRSLTQLDALFAPDRWPAAGLHGLERRDACGRLHLHGPERLPEPLLEELRALARRHPGLLLEDKGRAAALHYRQAASLGPDLTHAVNALTQRHGADALHVQPGAYVLELKPTGITKAHAIADFMNEPPFIGRTPLFAGDDLTDVHGFDAVAALGGWSIAVGPRVTAMQHLDSPTELRTLLAEFLARGTER
jgi:trehalose 6-phosphate phosphatase